jgi:hypothetical protein
MIVNCAIRDASPDCDRPCGTTAGQLSDLPTRRTAPPPRAPGGLRFGGTICGRGSLDLLGARGRRHVRGRGRRFRSSCPSHPGAWGGRRGRIARYLILGKKFGVLVSPPPRGAAALADPPIHRPRGVPRARRFSKMPFAFAEFAGCRWHESRRHGTMTGDSSI